MKLATLLKDVWQSLWRRPATEAYPLVKPETSARFRGQLHYNSQGCTGCCLCNKDCPANAIEMITLDKKNKRFVLRYDMDQCIYCGQCVQNCRFSCLSMSPEEWELAAAGKEPFTVYYGQEEDVKDVLAKFTPEDHPEAAPR
ncbi:MAG: 4Fe-4S binding protein [Anaerolineae bacterium]|nr:4Fe-4S binding protein [Anaerolineae bacterium]